MRGPTAAVGVLGVAMVVLPACTDETLFTDEERTMLEGYRLPAKPPADPSNQYADDARAAVLGKKFFFDARFSGPLGAPNDGVTNGSLGAAGTTGRVACVNCHDPARGGADHRSRPIATSLGAGYTGRNAPTIINAAYSDVAAGGWQFWDGRRDSLWSQVIGPLESTVEHNGSRLAFAHLIHDKYRAEYTAVFGPMPDLSDTNRFPLAGKPGEPAFDDMTAADQVAVDRVLANFGKAIAAYERRLVSTAFEASPFDQMLDGNHAAMTPAAVRGAKLFVGKAACDECHRTASFSDARFHNIGCPQEGEHALAVDNGRRDAISTVVSDPFNRAGAFSDRADEAHLRALVAAPADVGAFKTASLRNLGKTAPYMHDGVYSNLWDVVNHYNFGGGTGAYAGTKEATISPLLLDDRELDDLVEFLRSLDDGAPLSTPDFPEGLVAAPVLP